MTLDATDRDGSASAIRQGSKSVKAARGSIGSVRGMAARLQPSMLLQAEFNVLLPGGRSKKTKPFLCILKG